MQLTANSTHFDSQDPEAAADSFSNETGLQFATVLNSVRGRVSKRSLLLAFRQLALLVETGIDLAEALELVADTCRNDRLRDCLNGVFEDITGGQSLSAAVAARQQILGEQIAASILAGEASGRLVEVLRQTADQLEQDLQIRSTIKSSMAYPAILLIASGVVAAILIWFVLPQFEESFVSMGVDPPYFTEILLSGAGLIRENLTVVLIAGALFLGSGVLLILHPVTRRVSANLCLSVPFAGMALRNLATGQLFVAMGHMLGNGVALLEALQLVKRANKGAFRKMIEVWEQDVLQGKGLSASLDEFDLLPEGADAMLLMAEKSGKLESVFSTAGVYYRNEGSAQLRQLLKLSEPVIIILLGGFVGVVVASVLLPILDVQSAGTAG